jgi:hypothetical protein
VKAWVALGLLGTSLNAYGWVCSAICTDWEDTYVSVAPSDYLTVSGGTLEEAYKGLVKRCLKRQLYVGAVQVGERAHGHVPATVVNACAKE